MYTYRCEDCGIEFASETKKRKVVCNQCYNRYYNYKSKGKEYIPYLKLSQEEQDKIDLSMCRYMKPAEKKAYLDFRKSQRNNSTDKISIIKTDTIVAVKKDDQSLCLNKDTSLPDIDTILKTLNDMSTAFYNFDNYLKDTREKLNSLEKLQIDKTHEIELGSVSDEDLLIHAKEYQNILKARRITKASLEELQLIRPFVEKHFYNNQFGKDVQALNNKINQARDSRDSRKYSPREDKTLLSADWSTGKMYSEPKQLPYASLY